ncbi:MAG: nucleotidyltransferase domain-containing protein [Candidatus Woesearchaeota archaeon]
MKSINFILKDASSFIQSEFNLRLQKSKLKIYDTNNWQEFCSINGFNVNSEGLYVPISYSAYVKIDSPVFISNVFHEFYGHGLFCEHSKIGQKLVDILIKGKDEKPFFGEVNTTEQLFGIAKSSIDNYEGFAIWLEALICEETGNSKIWELKKERLPNYFISLFEYFKDAEQRLSRFGFMSQLGFPKFYDKEKILEVLKRLYSSYFYNIEFIILYGSQKPESDIDLFVVSKNSSLNYYNGWLDIYEVNKEEFNYLCDKLDISVTDPIFSGKLIYGDKNYFEQIKQKILEQPITQEAIAHNIAEAEKLKELLNLISENDKRRKDCLSYIKSYSKNAEQLALGNKPLTLKNLELLYEK